MCFRVATVGGKTQLTCLESLLFLSETSSIDFAATVNSPEGLQNVEQGMYDYPLQLRNSKIFDDLLNNYLHLSGRALGEIDDDHEESGVSDESDSDYVDENYQKPKAFNTIHGRTQYQQTTSLTVKEQICSILLRILKTVFAEQFEEEVRKSQVDHAMCSAINDMDFGGTSKISTLADSFGKMAYQSHV